MSRLHRIVEKQKNIRDYQTWIDKVEPKLFKLNTNNTEKDNASNGPLISIVVPCFNTPKKYLTPLLQSVLSQTYQNWQLCMADGSTNKEIKKKNQETF